MLGCYFSLNNEVIQVILPPTVVVVFYLTPLHHHVGERAGCVRV